LPYNVLLNGDKSMLNYYKFEHSFMWLDSNERGNSCIISPNNR